VLFVHGVGRHSRLSSLLRAYQSLRANLQSPEAPLEQEDLFHLWKLGRFDEGSDPVHLELVPRHAASAVPAARICLYEVNYSAVAGVIRSNHRLDMTHLFVSLDLAVNVARTSLSIEALDARPRFDRDVELAHVAQGLTGVMVAATVPILGIPSLVVGRWVTPIVSEFVRFFEDVATFALDPNGEALISAHIDHTMEAIVKRRNDDCAAGAPTELVVVAHSLGTVVMHSFLVRNWLGSGTPNRLVTLGSPIGLVTWLWRFLDFERMELLLAARYADRYFSWTPIEPPREPRPSRMEWVNVVNYLDPIATAFPQGNVYLTMPAEQIADGLEGGTVQHHYLKPRGLCSLGFSHTEYFDDADFIKLLGQKMSLTPTAAEPPLSSPRDLHWQKTKTSLSLWRWGCLGLGWLLIGVYLAGIASAYGGPTPWAFALVGLLFAWPPLVIGTLAFFQRLIHGGPTKRTRVESLSGVPPKITEEEAAEMVLQPLKKKVRVLAIDLSSIAYHVRHDLLRLGREDVKIDARRPGEPWRYMMMAVSFLPSLAVMLIPVWWLDRLTGKEIGAIGFVRALAWWEIVALVVLFMLHTLAFAASEFTRHWRNGLKALGL
jgi:hypothetical protein